MAFEKTVLDKVARVLKQDRQAGFRNCTLFVWATESDSRRVLSMLRREYNNKVEISQVCEGEYAYDFVA
jgi:hypothetical protein